MKEEFFRIRVEDENLLKFEECISNG
jgi:hypothetical protein